jgi:hypothetical protein
LADTSKKNMHVALFLALVSCAQAFASDSVPSKWSTAAASMPSADGVAQGAAVHNEPNQHGEQETAKTPPRTLAIVGSAPPAPRPLQQKQQQDDPMLSHSSSEQATASDGRMFGAKTVMQLPWSDKLSDEPIPEEERLKSATVHSSFRFSHTSKHQGPNGEETHHTRLEYDIEHHDHIFRFGDESSLPGRKFAFCSPTDLVMLFEDEDDQRKAALLLERTNPATEKNVLFVQPADGFQCDAHILELTPLDHASAQPLVEKSLDTMRRARQYASEVHASRSTTTGTADNSSTAPNATFTFPLFSSGLAFATRQLSMSHLIKNGYMDFFTNHSDYEFAQLPISATWLRIHAQASTQLATGALIESHSLTHSLTLFLSHLCHICMCAGWFTVLVRAWTWVDVNHSRLHALTPPHSPHISQRIS